MHYSAMLGHSNQRLLSACIYCVNNDRTLKFSTEAVCLSFPLHPVPSCKCSVYPVSTEDSVWLEMFRWGISPPLNLIPFHASSLCFWSDHFLWRLISLEVTFALSFLLCLCLNQPFHMCPLQILQWHFFWFLFEDGQMRGSLPCTMINLLVMIFGRVPLEMTAGLLYDMLLLSSNPRWFYCERV